MLNHTPVPLPRAGERGFIAGFAAIGVMTATMPLEVVTRRMQVWSPPCVAAPFRRLRLRCTPMPFSIWTPAGLADTGVLACGADPGRPGPPCTVFEHG